MVKKHQMLHKQGFDCRNYNIPKWYGRILSSSADVLYVATCNPVSLYSMKKDGQTVQLMELYDVFPRTISGVWQPFVTVAPLGSPLDGQVVLHEEQVRSCIHREG